MAIHPHIGRLYALNRKSAWPVPTTTSAGASPAAAGSLGSHGEPRIRGSTRPQPSVRSSTAYASFWSAAIPERSCYLTEYLWRLGADAFRHPRQRIEAVLETLAEGSARVLLIRDDPGAPPGRPGSETRSRAPVTRDRVSPLRRSHAANVAIRAALLTGSDVRILTSARATGVDEEIAARLRRS